MSIFHRHSRNLAFGGVGFRHLYPQDIKEACIAGKVILNYHLKKKKPVRWTYPCYLNGNPCALAAGAWLCGRHCGAHKMQPRSMP